MPDPWTKLIETRSLPRAFRGYDRDTTDDFLAQLETGMRELISERNAAQARNAELEQRVADERERQDAMIEALVAAGRIRADSEREAEELKAKTIRESALMESEGKRKADEILRAAEADAKAILEDARSSARDYMLEIREARQLAHQTRARLVSLLESLLIEVNGPLTDFPSAVDELLQRVGDADDGDRQPSSAGLTGISEATRAE